MAKLKKHWAMDESCDFIDLLSIDKLSESKLYTLLEKFKSPKIIKQISVTELTAVVGVELACQIAAFKPDDDIKRKYESLQALNIKILPYYASEYPAWLKNIDHFPPILFVRGSIKIEDEISLAVIGTRSATTYGKNIAENFAADFAKADVTVISGMARGVDTAAHLGALKNDGRTIAVLGCGIDLSYPPENQKLMCEIINHGAVISEFNIGTPPWAQNFPKRNRIISGLAKAVVAIEAKEKSGVMNTVRWALDQNKDIFAVPGNIYAKTSQGTNQLIKDGAIPVTTADEILESLGIKYTKKERTTKTLLLHQEEKLIWDQLSLEPIYLDVLAENLKQPTSQILNILLDLEIKGLVKQLPGMMFVKNFE